MLQNCAAVSQAGQPTTIERQCGDTHATWREKTKTCEFSGTSSCNWQNMTPNLKNSTHELFALGGLL